LPCAYYLLTFTLPAPIRSLACAQQKALYGLLLSSAAAALQKLAWDPRYVGGRVAMLAILHTWTRRGLDPMRFARSAVGAGIACSAAAAWPRIDNTGSPRAIPPSWFPASL